MTLRAMWTYDHIANPTNINLTAIAAYTANNAYNQLTGNPGTLILRAGSSSCLIGPTVANASPGTIPGAGLTITNSASFAQGLAVALADIPLLQGGVTKAYFGFRTWSTALPSPSTLNVIGVATSPTAVPTPLVTEAQLARIVNVPQYVEVMVDISADLYTVWVDGNKIIDAAALPASWSYLVFGANAVATATVNQSYRDYYFVDADSTSPNVRLGPIQSQLANLTAVSAPNYTSSDNKTPLADFQTAYSGAPTATPNISNAPSNDPVTVSFQSQTPVGANILAVQYKMAASVSAAAQMTAEVTNGTDTKNLPTYTFADLTMDYGRDLSGVQTTDPSGNPWSATRFAATQLIVQPQAAT